MELKCNIKLNGTKIEPILLFLINIQLILSHFTLHCVLLVYSNTERTYETYNLRIRNTDARLHLVSCYNKPYVSNEKCCFL